MGSGQVMVLLMTAFSSLDENFFKVNGVALDAINICYKICFTKNNKCI